MPPAGRKRHHSPSGPGNIPAVNPLEPEAQGPETARAESWRGVRVYTIGHSTRPLDELVDLLRSSDVSILADIRTIPRSRHNPQFDGEALRSALPLLDVRYVHLPALGGLRRARPDSPNAGWRNASFRGYADYMMTEAFEHGLAELEILTAQGTLSLMCAEAVPWRCHRSLVADALIVRGAQVEHITGPGQSRPHRLTPFAHVEGTRISYPGEDPRPPQSSRSAVGRPDLPDARTPTRPRRKGA